MAASIRVVKPTTTEPADRFVQNLHENGSVLKGKIHVGTAIQRIFEFSKNLISIIMWQCADT
jgi:hypothetical protein